jgi:hypothetical protein
MEGQRAVDHLAQPRRVPGAAQVGEVEHGMQLVRAQVQGHAGGVGEPDLADQDPAGVLGGYRAPGPVDVVHVVAIGVGRLVAGFGVGLYIR